MKNAQSMNNQSLMQSLREVSVSSFTKWRKFILKSFALSIGRSDSEPRLVKVIKLLDTGSMYQEKRRRKKERNNPNLVFYFFAHSTIHSAPL